MSCRDPSVRIVTKSLKVGPLLIFSISLVYPMNISFQVARLVRSGGAKRMCAARATVFLRLINIQNETLRAPRPTKRPACSKDREEGATIGGQVT